MSEPSILMLLDELQTIAQNGLLYAENPYDRERYERLLQVASEWYGTALALPPAEIRARLQAEIGYRTPKVGASAAIFNEEGAVLLVLRTDDNTWCLPCGWLGPNETPLECAIRETWEETGFVVAQQALVNVHAQPAGHHAFSHVSVTYLCRIVGGTRALSHETSDVQFWQIDDVPHWHPYHDQRASDAARLWHSMRMAGTP